MENNKKQEIELPMEQAPNTLLLSFVAALHPAGPFVCPSDFVYGIRAPRFPDPLLSGYSFSSSSEMTSCPGFVDEQLETQSKKAFTSSCCKRIASLSFL